MTLNVALDRIIPVTEARARLSEIIQQTSDDQFWVLTWRGRPRVAVVDVKYLDRLIRRFESGNAPMAAQVPHSIGGKAQSRCCPSPLSVENAGDDRIAIMRCKPTDEVDGIFVSANGRLFGSPKRNIDFSHRAAAPSHGQMRL